MAPATDRHALIVAHGSPSDPMAQETAIRALAAKVAALLPGWTVRGATLAAPDAVAGAMTDLDHPIIYPFFMAPGWFVDTYLPTRTGPKVGALVDPLGLDPILPFLVADTVRTTLAERGQSPSETTVLVAAHGNPKRPESGRAVRRFATALKDVLRPYSLQIGFIEQPPFLGTATTIRSPAICVPFFATDACHVTVDVPSALSVAGFSGDILPPLIHHPSIEVLVAESLQRNRHARSAA